MEQILLSLALMLLFAKLLGNLFERFGVASLVGEILAGVVLGPVLGWVVLGDFIGGFMTLGIIFLMFIAGIEVRIDDIKDNTYKASVLAVSGGVLSFLLGALVGMVFFNDWITAIAIGTVIISTSNGALFLMLVKAKKFDTKIGKLIMATTIADDVVGIMAIALFRMYTQAAVSFFSLFSILLVALGFYLFILTTGSKAITKVVSKLHMFSDEYVLFAIPVAIMFLFSFITDNLGLSLAAGAFLAGMALSNSHFADPVIQPKISTISYGLMLPIFYAAVGTLLVFSGLDMVLISAIIAACVVGKFIGCGILSKFLGLSWDDAKLMGIAMIPRGGEDVGILQLIVIASAAGVASAGITTSVYTSIIFAIIATTVMSPIIAKIFVK